MPKFFFDSNDGTFFLRDDVGTSLSGIQEARDMAFKVLGEMAKDKTPADMWPLHLAVDVRNPEGSIVAFGVATFRVH